MTVAVDRAPAPSERRHGILLWLAQYVSATGDALFIPCLGWLATNQEDQGLSVGLAVFVATVPHLLFGPLAGSLADRFDRLRLMIVCDVGRFLVLTGLAAFGLITGHIPFGVLIAAAFVLASLSAPFMAARDAILPELVSAERLPRWNALLQTSGHLALIQGLGLGGLLLWFMGHVGLGANETERVLWVLAFDALTFVVSAVFLLGIRRPARAPRSADRPGLLSDVAEGLRYARRDRVVGGLLVLTALNNFAIMGPAIVGAVLLVKDTFGLGPSALTWLEATMAVGMLAGAILLARRGRAWPMGRILLWGMVMDGLTYIPVLWIPSYPLVLVLIVVHGFFIPFIVVGRTTLVQMHVPDAKRGKVFALVNLTVMGVTSLSALTCGLVVAWLGPRALFGIAGVFGALSGFLGMYWVGARFAQVRPAP